MTERTIGGTLTRREFNQASITALFVGMSVWMGACGSDSASPSAPTSGSGGTSPASADRSGSVSANHGHVATVTSAQLQAGGAVTLHIKGSADHDHTVELSSSEVTQVAGGGRVTKSSSTDASHNHTVTFN